MELEEIKRKMQRASRELSAVVSGELAAARSAASHDDGQKAKRRIDDAISKVESIARSLR